MGVSRWAARLGLWLCAAILLAGAGWGSGFAAFDQAARSAWSAADEAEAEQPGQADGIVALTGGADRIETALHLLETGAAPLLLISGVGRGADLTELRRGVRLSPEQAERVTLGRTATTTLGNAEETAAWVQAHGIRRLLVVTAGYHMPRALIEIGRAVPGVRLFAVPVRPPALRGGVEAATVRMLANEYDKYLAVRLGLTRKIEAERP